MATPTPMLDRFTLYSIFMRLDKDTSGQMNATELQAALSNGTWRPFNPETVRLMIGMFDHDNNGTINFEEFVELWRYITGWLNCFKSFDADNSGTIDKKELKTAFTSFGFRLSDQFFELLIKKFDRASNNSITFDDYIQACVMVQTLTAAFREHDRDQSGIITITYEDFLMMVVKTMFHPA
ncbi:programmed cell death protein 6-like isoform X2 [Uloborus diversus]|uniref:programmed cell death protein 6-like isoform X2 n=1 Tax=Uloborus diversus TaxID=327109 RepID=UPI0024090DCA|nr:programmed cell death protein 6-like isoform X2 [Uloborus diversus]